MKIYVVTWHIYISRHNFGGGLYSAEVISTPQSKNFASLEKAEAFRRQLLDAYTVLEYGPTDNWARISELSVET